MCISLISTYKDIQKLNDSVFVPKNSQEYIDLKVRTFYLLRNET